MPTSLDKQPIVAHYVGVPVDVVSCYHAIERCGGGSDSGSAIHIHAVCVGVGVSVVW